MKLTKNCRYLVRVRDYETAHIEVGAEISHHDIGYDDDAWACAEPYKRSKGADTMRAMLNIEVDRLAREELETIAEWSEISPNLAEDYLQTPPPANLQRNQHAKKTGSQSAPSGGLRRSGATPSTPTRPRPLRPA